MIEGLVSIIIPCYNYGFVLSDTLRSLQQQTYQNWEALIINDGSIDNTIDVANDFIKHDKRFRLFNCENQGVSRARNLGIANAKGEYIQFLDADDLLSAEKLNLQIEVLKNVDVDICYCEALYFKHAAPNNMLDKELAPHLHGNGFPVIKELLYASPTICSPLLKKHVLENIRFDPDLRYVEDWYFWLECALENFSFSYLDSPTAYVKIRIHPESISQQKILMHRGEIVLRNRIEERIKKSISIPQKIKKELLKFNRIRKNKVYKYVISYVSLTDYRQLKDIANQIGYNLFFISFIKALNGKRKRFFA